jgi:serine/threonine protein kinase
MSWLSDDAVARLRDVAEWPDFAGTRYTIQREIGRGGMGVVYEAEDAALARTVAIKVLDNAVASSHAAARMRREAQIIAGLEHPAIVPVHDVGELADGRVFYAMKLVRGLTLDAFARDHALSELVRIFLRVCEAVAFAHAAGIVHRDLKPQNVMIGEFGSVLVMDWGLATSEDGDASGGTPGFMPPDRSTGPAADVYALGVMLQSLGATLPRRLQAIASKAATAAAADRYANARELADDIGRYLDGLPVTAYRENAFEKAARWIERNRAIITVLLAYIAMRVIVFFWIRR